MKEAEALSIACRKPLVPCSLHLKSVPRSDTVADPARSDVLQEWSDLEQQGRRSVVLSKQGLSVGDGSQHRLARFKLPPVKKQGSPGGDK